MNYSLPGNPYAGPSPKGDAATQATLALAFEQRTANLIAELSMQALLDQQGIVLSGETVDALNARLGLDSDDA